MPFAGLTKAAAAPPAPTAAPSLGGLPVALALAAIAAVLFVASAKKLYTWARANYYLAKVRPKRGDWRAGVEEMGHGKGGDGGDRSSGRDANWEPTAPLSPPARRARARGRAQLPSFPDNHPHPYPSSSPPPSSSPTPRPPA